MSVLSVDFETRSDININAGGDRYFLSPETTVYCMGWAFDTAPVEVWVPPAPFPQRIVDHINAGGTIAAWNARFERSVFDYILSEDYGVPVPKMSQYTCTAARARAHGLPGTLAHCAQAMSLPVQKVRNGTRLIREYSALNVPWDSIPEADQALFIEYCRVDVETERQIGTFLRPLTPHEQYEYLVNECINDRGVPVDVELAEAAVAYATDVLEDIDERVRDLTAGAVPNARSRTERDAWLVPQLTGEQLLAITNIKKKKISLDEEHRQALAVVPGVTQPVLDYLTLMEEAGGATISKYTRIVGRHIEGRITGALQFNGAGQTGRFSSMGLQLHNLRRDGFEDPEHYIELLKGDYELPDVTTTLAKLVRSCIHHPDGLTWFDFSAIEGRVAPWLANSRQGEKKLDVYRKGEDPYIINALAYFGGREQDITKSQRQVGKVQELSLQFLGGAGALISMARGYGLHLGEDEAERLKHTWRQINPWAKQFGDQLDAAAFCAMMDAGTWQTAGRVSFAFSGDDWLWMKLPSGRLLAYYLPRIEDVETPWGDFAPAITTLWGAGRPKVGEEWPRRTMWNGLWIENATQAVAADLLREAILRVDEAGLDIVLHVHDEIMVEGYKEKELGELMLGVPAWADGLPLAGEGGSGTRYGK